MIKTYLTLLLIGFGSLLFAQNEVDTSGQIAITQGTHHALGVNAGFTTGVGLSYRIKHNNFAAQAVFMPLGLQYNGKGTFSASLTGIATIKHAKSLDVFLFLGTHYFYNSYWYSETIYDYSNSNAQNYYQPQITGFREVKEINQYLNVGFGPGLETNVYKNLKYNIMLGYGVYNILRSPFSLPTIEMGLFYYFK